MKPNAPGSINKYASCIAALVMVSICYPFARPFQISSNETALIASRFSFKQLPLAEVADSPPYKTVRKVHPSLSRISAWVSSLGAAATLADLDGDGLPNDVVLVDPRTDLVTVAPVPGTGERYKPFSLNASWKESPFDPESIAPMGSLAGDFNEDGAIDLLVYFWGRTPVLLLQKSSVSKSSLNLDSFNASALTDSDERWYSNAAIQADLDGDGHFDLLIGNYYHDGARVLDSNATGAETLHAGKAKALNGGHKHFFLWKSAESGTSPKVVFQHATQVLEEEVGRGWTLAMSSADLDGDMLPEIYIANDFGPDRLLHNRSKPGKLSFALLHGTRDFTTPKSCVLGDDSFKGMGVDFGDINGDGLLDIFVSNIATQFGLTESHFVWLNTGETHKMREGIAPFIHGSEQLGLSRSGFAWEARLTDFDNDGVLEAIQACGFIKGKVNRWPELQALGTSNDQIIQNPTFWPNFKPGADLSGSDCNPLFVRGGDGRFYNLSPALGLTTPQVSRGIAIADVDGDGRLDYVTANQWGPSFLFKNESPKAGKFLGLRLALPNGSPAIGAKARVYLEDGKVLVSRVDGGGGHSGRRSPELYFGLGNWESAKPVTVEIEWLGQKGVHHKNVLSLPPGWHAVKLRDPSSSLATL